MTVISVDTLLNLLVLRGLKRTTLLDIAHHARVVTVSADETFYEQGDPPTGLFVLQAGRVKLFRQSKERAQILAIPMPGDCFGAESFPTGAPSPCTATALTGASAIYIPPHALGDLLARHADLQELLLELVANRLKQLVSLIHDLAFRDVTSRLAAILVARARAEGRVTDSGICLDRLLSQQDFAAMAGTAREVIYRILKKFESLGLLHLTRNSIFILDLDRLAEVAGQEVR
jgi:CRP/FNR family transcriptional regulator